MSFEYARTHTLTEIILLHIAHIHIIHVIILYIIFTTRSAALVLRLHFLTYFGLFNKSFSRVLQNSNGNWTIAIRPCV